MESQPGPGAGSSEAAPSSDVAAGFRAAWRGDSDPTTAGVELLPSRLAKACVAVLPVHGAGLSLHLIDFRVPVGASDEMATMAERLQFTQGEGPCLVSAGTRRSLAVDATEMERRWPSFAAELFESTTYRAIVSLPLAVTPKTFGALDLYFGDAGSMSALRLSDTAAIAAEIAETLAEAAEPSIAGGGAGVPPHDDDRDDHAVLPTWLNTEPARNRTHVWVAMGMVMTQFQMSAGDAISLLRSYSYGHSSLLDDVARGLVSGAIDIAEVAP